VGANDGLITYRIDDPDGKFSDTYKSTIRASAQAWSDASDGIVQFKECPQCGGRTVVVVPGSGDGIADPAALLEQVLPMPVEASAPPPLHRIAHQWGHAIGLGHTYERADRDRYVKFDPAVWCGAQRSGLPPRCAFGPDQPGFPNIASDTFGVYDEKSKMNGFAIDGICGASEPDASSGMPADSDGSAVEELYLEHTANWAPFQPIARSISPTEPLDYQLADGVDPVGSPAITEWTPPSVEIFARGTNAAVYEVHNELFGTVFLGWSDWQPVATDVDADPAAVFVDANTLRLAVRAHSDGSIRLRTRTSGNWGAWVSLGAPIVGAASAPAIAAYGPLVSVAVLGNDGLIYVRSCGDPATTCAGNMGPSDAWTALDAPPPGTKIVSKPSATFLSDGRLCLTVVSDDDAAWLVVSEGGGARFDTASWQSLPHVGLMPEDPVPGVAVIGAGSAVSFYARGPRGRLIYAERWYLRFNLGGILASPPAVTFALDGSPGIHVAAVIEDHGRPGVWVKYYVPDGFQPPCNLNAPGTCAQCGCNVRNKPACEL
jgi:hypothetical protein